MKIIIILSTFIAIQAGVIKETKDCDGITINGTFYDSEVLYQGLDRPYLLTVDYSTNNLYFSYNIQTDSEEFRSARLNLNTKEFKNIEGVDNGFAQTVDQVTHDIYIGGSDGIYKYDYGKNKVDVLCERGTNIWNLYFKDVLYFSIFPSQFMYTYSDGITTRFADLEDTKVDHFVIDNDNDMFYTNDTGLYSQKKDRKKEAVLYNFQDANLLRSLTMDKKGNVYACLQYGIYLVNKATQTLEKVVDLNDGFGLAFDNDNNIVYSNATAIVRLKANALKKC